MGNNIMETNELLLNNDASLREYYIKLQNMYTSAVNMLTAINQSLSTSASEIELNLVDNNGVNNVVRIPSFLYLESKLEELSSNMDSIFNIPKDGEAWFTKNDSLYKLNLVRSNIAPISPSVKTSEDLIGSLTDNIFLKDLVFPKTYIKLPLQNIPSNVSQMFMRKIVINSQQTFLDIYNSADISGKYKTISYDECKARLYNLTENVDYTEYDSVIDLPIKKDYYKSRFEIDSIDGNSWVDNASHKVNYKVKLNTLLYENEEDSSIVYSLKEGDKICLGNEMTVFEIKSVFNDNYVQIEEYIGYAALQPYKDNSEMIFQLYVDDYSKFDYVQVPLEENQYIIVFLGTIWNNVRSILSDGLLLDLGNIKMIDEFGSPLKDTNGNQYNYLSYYREFCTNLGDLLLGMSKCVYSQITNYTTEELVNLLSGDTVKEAVSKTINSNNIKVVAINKHLTNDLTTEDIVNLHTQKNEVNAKLQTCQSNIDQVYSTMLTTDFSQNVTVTQKALQEKINGYYTERTELQKQLIAIVDNINSKADSVTSSESKTKYRIRGISDMSVLNSFTSQFNHVDIIGIDIEYKYKSTSKDTATLTTINGSTFTDWNKQASIDKERELVFSNGGYSIQYKDYSNIVNTIKWNQFDIPIKYGEDVVIRVRYKYSVGQPFITLYTPWSDELLVTFPTEFVENVELSSILETNSKDTVTAAFNKTLIDEGYAEHVQNKVLSNEQVFFHMPENIYSGFNTAENNLISLKDKLNQMVNDIEKYKQYIDDLTNTGFEIYLNYDDNSVLLSPNSINKINIYNTEHITDAFIRKDMNIVIKNTGTTRLNLYSLFPGNTDEHIITSSNKYISYSKGDYERVPLYIGDILDGQYFGQWIYFRSNNPYSNEDIYYNTIRQNAYDYSAAISKEETSKISYMSNTFTEYINKNNSQILLGFRNNAYISGFNYNLINGESSVEEILEQYNTTLNNETDNKLSKFDWFIYPEYINPASIVNINNDNRTLTNKYIGRYEDIIAKQNNTYNFIDSKTSLNSIANNNLTNGISEGTTSFIGAFLYPNLISKSQILITEGNNNVKYINVGESLSIPIVFEYYVEAGQPVITKSLYFDIRNSMISDPLHYMLEITGNYDYTTTGDVYKNIDDIIE